MLDFQKGIVLELSESSLYKSSPVLTRDESTEPVASFSSGLFVEACGGRVIHGHHSLYDFV